MTVKTAPDHIAYRRDPDLAVDFMKAGFSGPAFDRHAHDTFAIGLTLHGAQCFNHRGAKRTSLAGQMIVLNPGDSHDGEAGDADGFSYWMLYPDVGLWEARLAEATGRADTPFFADAVVEDPAAARVLAQAFAGLAERADPAARPRESLKTESLLDLALIGLAGRHGRVAPQTPDTGSVDARLLDRIRDKLEDEYALDLRVDDLCRETGRSRFWINRAFGRRFGLPPHMYLTRVRLERARRLLARGEPAAGVAAAVGLVDQSHLIRRFKGAYGITPGQYQRAIGVG